MAKEQTEVKQQKSLIAKLVEVLAEMGPVEKAHRNTHFGYNYVSEGQMMAELRGRLSSRNIFLFTSVESIAPHYGEAKEGTYVCVTTKHTFVDAESGETYVVMGAGVGWDSGDKGAYKAVTGATKYMLMKNFLVTDEKDPMDPEAGEQKPEAKEGSHRRTKKYEEETGAGNKKVADDLVELEAYLRETAVPEGFLLALLKERKLVEPQVKTLGGIKPGILRRCLQPSSKANLVKAWAAQQSDESEEEKKNGKKPPKGEVRTREGDQRREGGGRQAATDTSPNDVMEQEGIDDWRKVKIHFGDKAGTTLGKLTKKSLTWWVENWTPKPYKGSWNEKDLLLDAALCLASAEIGGE